jgi:gluconolactonase
VEKFAELIPIDGGGESHGPDGLRVATDGSIWASGKGGINVLKPNGALTCSIPFPNHVSNLAFGGTNGKKILVTSADKLYTINLK